MLVSEMFEYLDSIKTTNNEIEIMIEKMDRLRNYLLGSGISYDKDRVQSNGSQDRMAEVICKLVDIEKECDVLIDILANKKNTVKNLVKQMDNEKHKEIILERYVSCTPDYIAMNVVGLKDKTYRKHRNMAVHELTLLVEQDKAQDLDENA